MHYLETRANLISSVALDLPFYLREYGILPSGDISRPTHILILLLQVELIRRDYTANGGWETFLSYEDPEQGDYVCV